MFRYITPSRRRLLTPSNKCHSLYFQIFTSAAFNLSLNLRRSDSSSNRTEIQRIWFIFVVKFIDFYVIIIAFQSHNNNVSNDTFVHIKNTSIYSQKVYESIILSVYIRDKWHQLIRLGSIIKSIKIKLK